MATEDFSEKTPEIEEVKLPSTEDLKVLAFFYADEISKNIKEPKSGEDTTTVEFKQREAANEPYRKILEGQMRIYTMLSNFQHEGISTCEGMLMEIAIRLEQEKKDTDNRGVINLVNLQKFVEANKDKLPKNFLKAQAEIEEKIKKFEK